MNFLLRINKFWRPVKKELQQTFKLKSHVVITGSGRAGTTYLVHLLTALGLDTGYNLSEIDQLIDKNAKAGLEWDVRAKDAPFICKSPWFSEFAEDALKRISINHIIIPVRDFNDAAESRIRVTKDYQTITNSQETKWIPGGLVFTERFEDQLVQLQAQFIRLIQVIADYHVPVTFINFPRFAKDPEYLYKKLEFLLEKIDYDHFLKAYLQVTRPEYIHQFQ